MSTTILSKFQGALVGAVIGDCIGAVFEHLWAETISPDKVKAAVERVEAESEKDEQIKIWHYTDDTAMARSVAKSLIENQGFDAEDMAERNPLNTGLTVFSHNDFCNNQITVEPRDIEQNEFTENYLDQPNRGYGGGVVSVFTQLKESNYQDVFAPAKKQFNGEGSYGNGGAMRIAPAALFTYKDNDPEKSKELVTQITCLTHTHHQAILGANLQSYAVDMALNSSSSFSPDEMVDTLITLMKMIEDEPKKMKERKKDHSKGDHSEMDCTTYVQKLELIKDYLNRDQQPPLLTVHNELGADISAFDAVPAAVYSFLRSNKDITGLEDRNPFEKSVMYAISLGGDSDTVATMAGAIAGACYGIESIPKSWQKCCEGVDDAKHFAEGLFKLQEKL